MESWFWRRGLYFAIGKGQGFFLGLGRGEVTRPPIVQHWKRCVLATVHSVRIPPSPPENFQSLRISPKAGLELRMLLSDFDVIGQKLSSQLKMFLSGEVGGVERTPRLSFCAQIV
jgi:hypothetical protein